MGQTWSDRWIEFTVEPTMCGRTLEFRGRARDGARVEYRAGRATPFNLFEESALRPQLGFVATPATPLAGYLEPAPAGSEYPTLPRDQIVADTLSTTTGGFRLRGDYPSWLPEPEDAVLVVWGYRPDSGGLEALRLIEVQACPN